MTLDIHPIDGLPPFKQRTMPAYQFEKLMKDAGYTIAGKGDAEAGRKKIWWVHSKHPRVESIYLGNLKTVITAYHPDYSGL